MDTELLVIGGGPAGYTAALRAANRGVDATVVEADGLGGTCLNRGCLPAKGLLAATKLVRDAETAKGMGIYVEPYVDVGELRDWVAGIVAGRVAGVERLCRASGVDLVEGHARFVDDDAVCVDDERRISFEHAVIATGSRPMHPQGFDPGDPPILDAGGALSVDTVPGRLLVVGAGYIGLELATVFARLGSGVTVIEARDRALPRFGTDLVEPVVTAARDLGITFRFGERPTAWEREGGRVVVRTVTEDGTNEYTVDRVVVATGRAPVTERLGLDTVPLTTDEKGFVVTDERGRTEAERVFAVGDVAGEPMLAHAGIAEAKAVADRIAGHTTSGPTVTPAAVVTDPEIASVGATPETVRDRGTDPLVGQFPLSANGRALTRDATDGFVRIVATEEGRIVGGQIVGPDASELVGEIALAVERGATLAEFGASIHVHPTLSEATMEAAERALGRAIHVRNT